MNTGARLGIYGAGLVFAFGGTFAIAGALVPDDAAANWAQDDPAGHGDPAASTATPSQPGQRAQEIDVTGVTIARSGLTIGPIDAPATLDATHSADSEDATDEPAGTDSDAEHDGH
ncbi:hypothetical protein [Agrococcus sp. KRD186]|uniref:hypothetical protein n=1 Tax=Agrococcus sp. KRD186 TaxID=2729730 RepID=UPI0019D170CE|nr:hypothetical protein [Agrococcus sp. KRD186]